MFAKKYGGSMMPIRGNFVINSSNDLPVLKYIDVGGSHCRKRR